ncbi:ATP-binding cassette domain-containing protein [Pseudomonas brassicae]|uniref:ATP-binding cassette domain-containing protein n=1 Tax=Pseudomonas brassicae TaxID=2708063 RepID=UPI003B75D1EE
MPGGGGESGSGKTSLARTLAGLGDTAQASLQFDGQPLSLLARQRPAASRQRIQYIFQNPYRALNPRQTVAQCLQAPLEHFFGLKGAACRARIDAALARVALGPDTARKYPHHLSGGERQRVAIARALVCEPTVLICDEVTSALDVSVQAAILALLKQLQGDGMTLLFVTHDLGVVRAIADRVLVVEEGRIVEQGGGVGCAGSAAGRVYPGPAGALATAGLRGGAHQAARSVLHAESSEVRRERIHHGI